MMKGIQAQETVAAIVDGYDLDSLRQMLLFRLDQNLDKIVNTNKPFETVVFDLLSVADRKGWEAKLIHAAFHYNQGNALLASLYARYGFNPEISVQQGGKLTGDAPKSVTTANQGGLEKIIEKNNLFLDPLVFAKGVLDAKNRVCRVDLEGGAIGTGFLVGPDVVLTNFHVVEHVINGTFETASLSFLFDFSVLADGSPFPGRRCKVHTDGVLVHSPYSSAEKNQTPDAALPTPDELDFAMIRLDKAMGTDGTPPRGTYVLPSHNQTFVPNTGAIIVQHPKGRPLKIAIDMNSLIGSNANDTRLRYRTNTEDSSSGSPVFSPTWDLIALHHYGDPAYNHAPAFNQGVIQMAAIRKRVEDKGFGHLLS